MQRKGKREYRKELEDNLRVGSACFLLENILVNPLPPPVIFDLVSSEGLDGGSTTLGRGVKPIEASEVSVTATSFCKKRRRAYRCME
jgi:hypothetical protein